MPSGLLRRDVTAAPDQGGLREAWQDFWEWTK